MDCFEIKLHNRYGNDLRIKGTGTDGLYYLVGDTHYMRVIGTETSLDEVTAIDPDGGPMIGVGDALDGGKIKSIRFNEGQGRWEFTVE